jgi:GSH-dependent disulfide-bond oxidoreductase
LFIPAKQEIFVIDVYAFATPNSLKIPIALEDLGLAYRLIPVNLRNGEQKSAEFVAMNANAKIPVVVDQSVPGKEPVTLSESGAILLYLAEKTGRLLPTAPLLRVRVLEELFFHAAGLGPAFTNSFFQKIAKAPNPETAARALAEAERTLNVFDTRLSGSNYVAGDEFTIADIAHYGWLWRHEAAGVSLDGAPNVKRWFDAVSERDSVKQAISRTVALAS